MTQYSLGVTGDINAVMNAHNLAMVALTSRMQHERNYDDEKLLQLSGKPRLNIDPTTVNMGWVIDFCCQALRNIVIGMDGVNGKSDGLHDAFPFRHSGFLGGDGDIGRSKGSKGPAPQDGPHYRCL